MMPAGGTLGVPAATPPLRWQVDAACQDMPTDLFFPVGHGPRAQAQEKRAKEVCRACPVREACLDFALDANMQYGVFGGRSEEERRDMRRVGKPAFLGPAVLSEPA